MKGISKTVGQSFLILVLTFVPQSIVLYVSIVLCDVQLFSAYN